MTTFFLGVLQPSSRWQTPNKLKSVVLDSKLLHDEHIIRIIEFKRSFSSLLEWLIGDHSLYHTEMFQNFHLKSLHQQLI